MSKIVIALGGNALGDNPEEQKELVKIPAAKVVSLLKSKHQVIIGHGNGPQIGMIVNSFANSEVAKKNGFSLPFAEANAMSQGYIGLHLQNAICSELKKKKMKNQVQYVLTQTLVDQKDPAFKKPTKPVGPFYNSKQDAEKANPGSVIVEDSGRGYRKVVPSPKPVGFVGLAGIKKTVENKTVLIVGGGGGVPTVETKDGFKTVDGVIDKDFALAHLAAEIKADQLIILTAVERVAINFGKPNQKWLKEMTIKEAQKHIADKQFAPGSMLPKVEAAIAFVKKNPKGKAIIADLKKVEQALQGKSGTVIKNK